jgi:hypothetical protein
MTKETGTVLLLISAAALIGGLALDRHALARYGSAEAPRGILWDPRSWFRNWNSKRYFSESRGRQLSVLGRTMALIGSTIILYVFLFGP